MSLITIDYSELLYLANLSKFPIRTLEFMNHALVHLMQPTNVKTFQHDLNKLEFSTVQGTKDDGEFHRTTYPMLNFTAKKQSDYSGTVDELKYRKGKNPLKLDYDQHLP